MSKVSIIVLNWNGWRDTIECLESLFRLQYRDYQVVVCDNGSQDDSLTRLQAWAEGKILPPASDNIVLRDYSFPPVPKPIPYVLYPQERAEQGGDQTARSVRLVFISIPSNLGYAGGNNVGLRYVLARGDFDYVWLLNNDTVVLPDALRHLVQRMQECPAAGLCGSTLLYYDVPHTIQGRGGFWYNPWLAVSKPIGQGEPFPSSVVASAVEQRLFGIGGASVLVSRDFLRGVGLLSEEYFLYFEEQDWAARGRGRFDLAYAPKSIVYHKEGRATGATTLKPKEKSERSDYYYVRSRLIFTRKFYPWCLPTVYLAMLVTLANRIRRGQWRRLGMIVRLLMGRHGELGIQK